MRYNKDVGNFDFQSNGVINLRLKQVRREPSRARTTMVSDGSSVMISINPEATTMEIDNNCIREISRNSRSGKLRCENDQHASMEYSGRRYSR